jgi:hypothetical protein
MSIRHGIIPAQSNFENTIQKKNRKRRKRKKIERVKRVSARYLSTCLDVRDTSKLVGALAQLRGLARLPGVVFTRLAVTHGLQVSFDKGLEGHGPVTVTVLGFKELLLADEIFLSCCRYWQHAHVDDESVDILGRRGVVVRGARIPEDEITFLGADLDPLVTSLLQPFQTRVFEQVHLVSPSETTLFISECVVVLLADLVASLQSHKTAILGAVGHQVKEALYAA